ncbi:MAG TPA: Na+/H+ antiporter NhaA [Mycobacteriales bacterium]|nr:Na+/H+ antiporter NhaA [Mycobacteriales bacterium]
MSRTRRSTLLDFLHTESSGGVVLLTATVVALVWANSPYGDRYARVFDADTRHWVNDGLMAIFFLVVGLEIKRELVVGELRDRRVAALPALAALGGMAVPALVYTVVNLGRGGELRGWAIPMATDIAFCVGIMALLGDRVAPSLKLFLLSLAIVDDIGAIAVIALFYSDGISVLPLLLSVVLLMLYAAGQRWQRGRWPVYVVLAVGAWAALFTSGVHPTLAGVAVGLLTRVGGPAERAERLLHPWSVFLVVPLFALANAGLRLSAGAVGDALTSRVGLGIALGLVVGKTVGVVAATWIGVRTRLGTLPAGEGWTGVTGAALLAGVGFTVSLFVRGLAFDDAGSAAEATVGILAGSLVAAVAGALVLGRSGTDSPPLPTPDSVG